MDGNDGPILPSSGDSACGTEDIRPTIQSLNLIYLRFSDKRANGFYIDLTSQLPKMAAGWSFFTIVRAMATLTRILSEAKDL